MKSPLVSTAWLVNNLNLDNLIILDASQTASSMVKDNPSNYLQIPNARIFDVKNIFSDVENPYPNAFPKPIEFQQNCQELGINGDSIIVVYDDRGIFISPRVWWMFMVMGHHNVFVLDGGLPAWKMQGYLTTGHKNVSYNKGDFKTNFESRYVKDFVFIQSNLENPNYQVVDVRSSARFNCEVPESRKGLRSGHIPHSINLPYTDVLVEGKYKTLDQLSLLFKDFDSKNQTYVFSCGSGITACVVYLAMYMVGFRNLAVFDGSWTEYGSRTS